MARPAGEPLTKISLRVRSADLDMIKRIHPTGYQGVIKELVSAYVKTINQETAETFRTLERMYPDE